MRSSALAGAFAATAGMLGKLGADSDTSALQHLHALCTQQQEHSQWLVSCAGIAGAVRISSIALMLVANAVMLHLFVRGLHETDSLTATVTSASINFMLSAAGGALLFHERLPLQWFAGATLILVGMGCLLHGDSPSPPPHATKPKQT